MARVTVMIVLAAFSLAGCSEDPPPTAQAPAPSAAPPVASTSAGTSRAAAPAVEVPGSRWYGADRVARGADLFARTCASCHGANAQGSITWRERGADGNFPPPPLNGTAHAWHHPGGALAAQIKFGAPAGQGVMPGFASVLTDDQVLDVIAWFQSTWPDEIYARWTEIEMRAQSGGQ